MADAPALPSYETGAVALPRRRPWVVNFMRTEPLGTFGAALIVVVVLGALLAGLIAQHDPQKFSADVLQSPSGSHWFGTSREGKDVFARVIYGARLALKVGIATVIVSIIGGTALALLAGYLGGAVDWALSRLAELMIGVPPILMALVLYTSIRKRIPDLPLLSKGELLVIIVIIIIYTPFIFRIMRGAVIEQRGSLYVESARVMGASQVRIMARHIVPNLVGLMIIISTTTLPSAILLESGLSFLGFGVEVGTPSWGADLSGTARSFFVRAPWTAIFPGLALSITVLGFNLLGDSLRDALDPRLRGKI